MMGTRFPLPTWASTGSGPTVAVELWRLDWLRRRVPAALLDWLPADSTAAPASPVRAICPFCGQTYAEPRQRCATCGGLPVVEPEDTRVYETVLGPCGSACLQSSP